MIFGELRTGSFDAITITADSQKKSIAIAPTIIFSCLGLYYPKVSVAIGP